MFQRITVLIAMIALSICGARAGGKADEKLSISFHVETEASDNPKMIVPFKMPDGSTKYFRRVPDFSVRDIENMAPFPADDESTYGIVFKLKENAAQRYEAISLANEGKMMCAQVNGRFVDAVIIDKAIKDGVIVIWRDVTLDDINAFDKIIPRIGQKKPKGNKK
ncbi:hypothetical protein JIN85_09335 [Luteolibacter pohnpeiensis]|uniref:Uncharacterized protein n=1 Tax=Luteolibacter pohnpeiensis TaxID=454153 RepID=A0A934SC79_9BACT|nr:hypothetical protein [Luteolibacter pohnpeiensis]MBK1882618.1 hypothetical protein [Luteolibacter pohnpeiensis]